MLKPSSKGKVKGKIMKDLTGKCPVMHGAATTGITGTTNSDWWPNQLNLNILRQHDRKSNPLGDDFDYRDEYNSMFGWRARTYDQMNAGMSIRDYGGEITETLEFVPEMSTSIE